MVQETQEIGEVYAGEFLTILSQKDLSSLVNGPLSMQISSQ